MIFIVSLIIAFVSITGCEGEPKFTIEEGSKRQFAVLPGRLGVTVENDSGRWHCIVNQGTLVQADSLPEAPYEASAIQVGYVYGATGLPVARGYHYRGPYLASPDKRYVAASATAEPSPHNPTSLVIVDMQTKKTVAVVKGYENRYVDGLAWSSNSNFVAILKHSSRVGYSPLDFLAQLLGHGVLYSTYYVEVVNLAAETVAQTKLTSGVQGSWGWVVWME
jgi:hypothetical protein